MASKVLISGEASAGKTTLIRNLKDSLLLSHDGKKPIVKIPHVYVRNFNDIDELIELFNSKIEAYNDKYDAYPSTVIIDSVSRIYNTINTYCNEKYTGFVVYNSMDKEIAKLNDYIEETLIASDINVILISHALSDKDTGQYKLVGKGSYAKLGGALSTVEEAVFIEKKATKRIVHLRSTKFPARSLQEDLPDSIGIDDFDMQAYLDGVSTHQDAADDLAL
jgi:GTPase SAR1 family protein